MTGRDFAESDNQKGAAPTAIVSYGFWRNISDRRRTFTHSTLKVSNTLYSVIGVMPGGFQFPADVSLGGGRYLMAKTYPELRTIIGRGKVARWGEARTSGARYQRASPANS